MDGKVDKIEKRNVKRGIEKKKVEGKVRVKIEGIE